MNPQEAQISASVTFGKHNDYISLLPLFLTQSRLYIVLLRFLTTRNCWLSTVSISSPICLGFPYTWDTRSDTQVREGMRFNSPVGTWLWPLSPSFYHEPRGSRTLRLEEKQTVCRLAVVQASMDIVR